LLKLPPTVSVSWSAAVINIGVAYITIDSVRVMIRSSHQHWRCLHYHRQCPCHDPQQSSTLVLLTLPPTVSVSWSAAVINIGVAYITTDSVRVMIRSSHQHWCCLHYHRQCPCHRRYRWRTKHKHLIIAALKPPTMQLWPNTTTIRLSFIMSTHLYFVSLIEIKKYV